MTRRSLGAKRHAFDAWRQVVETSFAICHYDVFSGDRREAVILNLLQEMLIKVNFSLLLLGFFHLIVFSPVFFVKICRTASLQHLFFYNELLFFASSVIQALVWMTSLHLGRSSLTFSIIQALIGMTSLLICRYSMTSIV